MLTKDLQLEIPTVWSPWLQTQEPRRKTTTTTSCFEDCSSWEHSAWRCKLGCSGKLLNGDLCHSKAMSHMVFNTTTTFIKGFPITSFTYLIFGDDSGRIGCMRTPSHRARGLGVGMGKATLETDCRIPVGETHWGHLRAAIISISNDRAMLARILNCLSQPGIGQA